MNPFSSGSFDDFTSRSDDGGSRSFCNTPSSIGDSVFRKMLWSHYSTSLHFFGGNLFPSNTTTTASHYNSSRNYCSSSVRQRDYNDQHQAVCKSGDKMIRFSCPDTLTFPRPTSQLLKLIRRRRGTVNAMFTANNGELRATPPNLNVSNDVHDDSWNSVRYHIVSRPTDCRYVCYSSNLSTPLHAACLYRAPHDVILMLLTAWPAATIIQDAEGWTPLHVHILYNRTPLEPRHGGANLGDFGTNMCQTTATESLIRVGGAQAAARHSRFVGSPLHLACRHNVTLTTLAELLQVCPEQIRIPNEAGGFPADLLWKAVWKEKIRQYEEKIQQFRSVQRADEKQLLEHESWKQLLCEYEIELMIRLNLMMGAFLNDPILLEYAQRVNHQMFCLNDVVRFHYECARKSDFVQVFLKCYPIGASKLQQSTHSLPLHVASSYNVDDSDRVSSTLSHSHLLEDQIHSMAHQTRFAWPPTMASSLESTSSADNPSHGSMPEVEDPLETLLRSYPMGAYVRRVDDQRTSLHIALIEGKRTWRTGIRSIVATAPETVEWKDTLTRLFPFQLAAIVGSYDKLYIRNRCKDVYDPLTVNKTIQTDVDDRQRMHKDIDQLETIYCLLLACPHVLSKIRKRTG